MQSLRIALYFFKFTVKLEFLKSATSVEVMMAACSLAAEDKGLGQFFAMCPVALQNMHSLLSRYHFHFVRSNLLSLSRTEGIVVIDMKLKNF